jgi:cobaltochelatase CobT
MSERKPIAFLSYVRSDDEHDEGRITTFRKRLEGEVRMQTGETFQIFQDRNDIAWGQHWEERIGDSLADVTFLIPIVTPSFFKSPACKMEFRTFVGKERMLGVNRLILPLYYVECDQLGETYIKGTDEIADVVRSRNWTDWRQFRFKAFNEEEVANSLAKMASMIKDSMKELGTIEAVSSHQQPQKSSASTLTSTTSKNKLTAHQVTSEAKAADIESASKSVPELKPEKKPQPLDERKTRSASYYAYTKRFDEIIDANDLADPEELLKLHEYLIKAADILRKNHGDSLDLLLSRFSPKEDIPSLAISVLIDNSGSMRGRPIIETAAWALLSCEWLDRLRISNEFLGFTTRAWKGGQSRELWLANKKPENPGRLNDLRHVIYKSFDSSIGASATNFGLMVREGLLKENIDGEALLWSMSRLNKRTAKHKLQIIISDGAPVDDSTLSANPGDFLEKHLREVIDNIPPEIQVYAMGVEHDVSRYYPNAVTVDKASNLGPKLFELLVNDPSFTELFSSTRPKRRYRFGEK